MEFKKFSDAAEKQFNLMASGSSELFVVDVEKDVVWDMYLSSFPEGTNKIFKERAEYDCNFCRQFIRNVGNVVAIVDGKLVTVWDIIVEAHYQDVANALSTFIKSHLIKSIFLHPEKKVSIPYNIQELASGDTIKWHHFSCELPPEFVSDSCASAIGDADQTQQVFKRGLDEISLDAIEIVSDLIEQSSIYRGDEFKSSVQSFLKLKKKYSKLTDDASKNMFAWSNYKTSGARIRNTVIGTLIQDISDNVDLDNAIASYESKVAPTNYKRTSAPVTKGMIETAVKKIDELGLEASLHRRFATIEDISINNVLFADRSSSALMKDSLTDVLLKDVKTKGIKKYDGVEEIGIDDFIKNVIPKVNSIELLVRNKHIPNMVSLIAPKDAKAKKIFQWDNLFSWSYNGNIADSMKARVQAAGGRVGGALRFTHSWNHDGHNQSLMDLHVFMPGNEHKYKSDKHNNYGKGRRVGWNHRKDISSGGVQDVDYTSPPGDTIPIENISFEHLSKMPEGKYIFKIHNWDSRQKPRSGFKAEIEFGNDLYQYEYSKPLAHKEWVTVAEAVLKDGVFTITHKLSEEHTAKEEWGITTEKFQKVSTVMFSPNHWDGQTKGNKHYMFMLDDCINPEEARGIYNEFLRPDLTPHRKVFELLGSKFKCEASDTQLSGLGFSSTQRNDVICKVKGSFTRTLKIKF